MSNDARRLARRGLMFVLSSPSGAGKTTLTRRLMKVDAETALSISATTRPPRPGEVDGKDYFFVDGAAFERMIQDGAFLEWAHVFGNRYGTPRAAVEDRLSKGSDVVFDVDWQGARALAAAAPDDRQPTRRADCRPAMNWNAERMRTTKRKRKKPSIFTIVNFPLAHGQRGV